MATRARRTARAAADGDGMTVGVGLDAGDALDARIVDAAIDRAEAVGWDDVRLSQVAAGVGIPLADLLARFRDQDAIADAWFARGRAAMCAAEPDEAGRPPPERLAAAMLRWFDALAPHRRVTVQMLQVKLWPFHPHHTVPMVFSLSRHVQLWRDVAGLAAGGPRRAVEEVALTWLFLATLAVWAMDTTAGQDRTRAFLRGRLAAVDSSVRRVFRTATAGPPPAAGA